MGQQVAVVEKQGTHGLLRLETNRSLTGMGHERFTSMADAVGPRPAAEVARQLFSTGKVQSVHIFGNIISVDIADGASADGLSDVVRNMYQYWKPGMEMPTFDAPAPEEAAAAPGAGVAATGGDAANSVYVQRVPENLRERSAAALAKWRSAH
jgi:hypothetical protein